MTLNEVMTALQGELQEVDLSATRVSVSLAFTSKKDRDGDVTVDFVDSGAMSKPRAEELHRLELVLEREDPKTQGPRKSAVREHVVEDVKSESLQMPVYKKVSRPPALPPKRG